jgi:PAS domain S-box-containing protein
VAVASAVLAVLLRLSLDPLWGTDLPFILFFPAIMVSAWLGGLGPGLLTTLLTALAAEHFWMTPIHALTLDDWGDLVGLATFVGVGAMISGLNEAWRNAAARVARSEERHRVTLESVGDAVIKTDERGRVFLLNRVAEALTGWAQGDAEGRPVSEIFAIVDEESRERAVSPVERALSEGVVTGLANHTLLLSKDGREIPIDDSAAPIRTADGRVLGAVIVFRDVSERRKAERERALLLASERAARAEIEASESQLRLALEAGRMGTWQWTIATGGVQWSPGLEAIHGYPAGSFPGTFEAFREEIHPEDRDRVLQDIAAAAEGARPHHIEYRIVRADGAMRWVEGRGCLFRDAEGRPERMVGVCSDITERKQMEERFQLAVEAAPTAMVVVDREGTIVLVNAMTESLLGYARKEIIGRAIETLVPMRLRGGHEAHRRSFASDPRRRPMGAGRDLYALRKDGSEVPVEIGLNPVETADGPVVLAAITDISERKRVESEREQILERERAAREEMERANTSKDEFLAFLSHELRTPLSAVLGWAGILRTEDLPPERVRQAIEAIHRNAQAEARLVESLLDLSRIQSGKLALEREPLDLIPVAQAAVEMFRPEAEAKGLRLEAVLPSSPVPVNGDLGRLQQIAWNLLSNAVKFTPAGGRIEVRLDAMDSQARIQVRDDGQGIDSAFLPHVFDRFKQAETGAPSRRGLGLGLAIVRELVQAHGGTVAAGSDGKGRGAAFTVTLPLTANPPPRRPRTPPVQEAMELPAPSIAALQVLIVDDHAETRALLKTLLEAHGAVARTASSVAEALDSIAESAPDALVADIWMPHEDGYALIRKLRAFEAQGRRRRVPAVAVTVYASDADRERALADGYDQHLAKPVEPPQLVRALARLCGRA